MIAFFAFGLLVTVAAIPVFGEEPIQGEIFFKPYGTKMFVIGSSKGAIFQFSLPSSWGISNISYYSKSFDVSSQDSGPTGVFFKPDGTKMFVIGSANDKVYQYSLGTAWDVSTATYDSKSFDVSSQESGPTGVFFRDGGTKMFITGQSGIVHEYGLLTGWDVLTATYDAKSLDVSSQDSDPTGVFFKPDGTKMFVIGSANDKVYQYSLGTAWDVSTATYDKKSFDVDSQDSDPTGVFFKPDGTKMFVIGSDNDAVFQYSLGTAWDVSTTSYAAYISIVSPTPIKGPEPVPDTVPPVVLVPNDMTIPATSNNTSPVTFSVSAFDDVDGNIIPSCFPTSGSDFPIGATTVSCTATDSAGNTSSESFTVILTDPGTTPPVILVPNVVSIQTTSDNPSPVTFSVSAFDDVDGNIIPSCFPTSGSYFPIGATTVSCTAADSAGNTSSESFTVIVTGPGTTSPVILVPNDVAIQTTSDNPSPVTFSVSAFDDVDGNIIPSCFPTSGSDFPIGATTVTCTAADAAGNNSSESFTVIVTGPGTAPPVILVPNDVAIQTTSDNPSPVTFSVSAFDDVDGNIIPSCFPTSGSDFPIGATTVTCTAADAAGNNSSESFTVTMTYEETILVPESRCGAGTVLVDGVCLVDTSKPETICGEGTELNEIGQCIRSETLTIPQKSGVDSIPLDLDMDPEKMDQEISERDSEQRITELEKKPAELEQSQDNGGGCLIATATYGTELAPQVQQLRELRDNTLLQTNSGTAFMESFNTIYYSFSPGIADLERQNPAFKEIVKIVITPMISSLSILNYVDMDSEAKVLGYGIGIILFNIGMYVGIPTSVIMRFRK